jgi:hypothetical protein
MKLPAVAIAAAFACGILLGQAYFSSALVALPAFPAITAATVCVLLVLGLALAQFSVVSRCLGGLD